MNKFKKAYRINVEHLVYAIMTKDEPSLVDYGTIKKLSEAMQIQLTPSVASGQLFGDGVKQSSIAKLTGMTAVLDVTKVQIDDRAIITGATYEDGVLIEGKDDTAPYIAIGWKVPQDMPGVAEYHWLLKGRARPYANTVQQQTDNINYSTDTITIEFVPRDFDGAIKYSADSADPTFTEEQAAKWFEKVPGQVAV